jgi:hypothetical protein
MIIVVLILCVVWQAQSYVSPSPRQSLTHAATANRLTTLMVAPSHQQEKGMAATHYHSPSSIANRLVTDRSIVASRSRRRTRGSISNVCAVRSRLWMAVDDEDDFDVDEEEGGDIDDVIIMRGDDDDDEDEDEDDEDDDGDEDGDDEDDDDDELLDGDDVDEAEALSAATAAAAAAGAESARIALADAKSASWASRRLRRRQTWEERFEDDPLRAPVPSTEWVKEPDRFTRWFVARSGIANPAMLNLRQEAWTHHMQWMRRSALSPSSSAKVSAAYTCLSADCMRPVGQIAVIRANSTAEAKRFISTEPLCLHGGVEQWDLIEIEALHHENATQDYVDPFVFIAENSKLKGEKLRAILAESEEYHLGSESHSASTVSFMGRILSSKQSLLNEERIAETAEEKERREDETDEIVESIGWFGIINAPTAGAAERYIAADPFVTATGTIRKVRAHVVLCCVRARCYIRSHLRYSRIIL